MGGLVFVTAAVLASLLCAKLNNVFVLCGLLCLVGFGYIGFKDDISKILGRQNHAGLSARAKFALQNFLAFLIGATLYAFSDLGGEFFVPFFKYPLLNLWIFAPLFWTIVISASSNAVNLTHRPAGGEGVGRIGLRKWWGWGVGLFCGTGCPLRRTDDASYWCVSTGASSGSYLYDSRPCGV